MNLWYNTRTRFVWNLGKNKQEYQIIRKRKESVMNEQIPTILYWISRERFVFFRTSDGQYVGRGKNGKRALFGDMDLAIFSTKYGDDPNQIAEEFNLNIVKTI